MKSVTAARRLVVSLAFLAGVGGVNQVHAQFGAGSSWVRTDAQGVGITLSVEACCNGGLRLTYRIPPMGGQPAAIMTVDSPMNGAEVPTMVGGKPSGQTMAIKRLDDRHFSAVAKMNGQPFGTFQSTVAADGKTMTVESNTQGGGQTVKVTEIWVRK
jgi:hypothetical protein